MALASAILTAIQPEFAAIENQMTRKAGVPTLLRTLRKKLNVSQEQLAQRLGVTWSTVNRWENGKGRPSPLAKEKLRKVLTEAGMKHKAVELDT